MTSWPADNIETRRVRDLVPYARNSRTHTAEQVDRIAASIKEFGFTNRVLIGEDGVIIAGHGRVMAANKLRLTEIPCMIARGWTEAQKRAYVIADNQLAIGGAGWDKEMLKVELFDLGEQGFDLALIGFDDAELTAILDDATPIETDAEGDSAGDGGDFLKFAKNKVPLTETELASLEGLMSRYVEIFGLAHGFARWIVDGKHLD